VKALQWLLTHSFYAKALAVKRVTSNSGSRTAGMDKVLWKTPHAKFKAINPKCPLGALIHLKNTCF
jgi:RNA-directed DNA polymerase